jgi:hypothetical protein
MGVLPIIKVVLNQQTYIQIPVTDYDPGQLVRCRWSWQTPTDECGDVCLNLPGAYLDPVECTITWTPVLRSQDTANGLNVSTYVVAITAEDFANVSSTTALSSTPLQMLIYVYTKPNGSCPSNPAIIGNQGARTCVGTMKLSINKMLGSFIFFLPIFSRVSW